MERPPTQLRLGIPFILLAAFANATLVLFVKLASESLPITSIIFSRYALTLLFIVISLYTFKRHALPSGKKFFQTERLRMHLLRGAFGCTGVISFYIAAKHLPLSYATVLFNTSPLFIPLIVYFWHHIKIIQRLWVGLIIGYIGVIVMLHPSHAGLHLIILVGLLSGICRSMVLIASRTLTYTEPVERTMLYYAIIGTIVGFVIMLPQLSSTISQLTLKNTGYLLAAGLMSYLYQYSMTNSTRYAPVRLSSSFLYVGVIISIFYDWFVWQVVPTAWAWTGMSLIIIGAITLMVLYPKDDYQVVEKKDSAT